MLTRIMMILMKIKSFFVFYFVQVMQFKLVN